MLGGGKTPGTSKGFNYGRGKNGSAKDEEKKSENQKTSLGKFQEKATELTNC